MSSNLEVRLDGFLITPIQIEDWERRRLQAVLVKLRRLLQVKAPSHGDSGSLPVLRDELFRLKEQLGRSGLRKTLIGSLRMAGFVTKLLVRFSGSRRKQCVVEMKVPNCSAQQLSQGIDELMANDTEANRRVNLLACPDHYLLEPRGYVLEVIETTGGAPFPAQFFMQFDDDSGLKTPRDAAFPYQSMGTARLSDGTVIGGVRHQFRDEENGALIRLMVEFPQPTLQHLIRAHQWHLACEFSHWIHEIQRRVEAP
jgi:hypothetical protein